MIREMNTTYGRSPGGYIWAILEPAAGIALLTFIFSIGFRAPPLGTDFALYYAAGVLPLLMYMDVSAKLSQTIQFNRALLVYPRISFLDALLARLILNVLTQFLVHLILMAGIIIVLQPATGFSPEKILLSYALTISLATGVGTFNAFMTLAFPIWQTAWAILNRPLFLVSCIFFNFETIPQPYDDLLWYNPLVHSVGAMRDGVYPFYQPIYVSALYVLVISGLFLLAGLFLLNRFHRDFLEK